MPLLTHEEIDTFLKTGYPSAISSMGETAKKAYLLEVGWHVFHSIFKEGVSVSPPAVGMRRALGRVPKPNFVDTDLKTRI